MQLLLCLIHMLYLWVCHFDDVNSRGSKLLSNAVECCSVPILIKYFI